MSNTTQLKIKLLRLSIEKEEESINDESRAPAARLVALSRLESFQRQLDELNTQEAAPPEPDHDCGPYSCVRDHDDF